jgi:acetyl-CoA synthetase
VFDYHDGDMYWCAADVGWVTGHSYIVYGPLANGATTLMFEGVPNYPDASRLWAVARRARGRGLGRTLLLGLLGVFRAAGLTHAELSVHGGNRGALRLYESVGMSAVSHSERWEKQLAGA